MAAVAAAAALVPAVPEAAGGAALLAPAAVVGVEGSPVAAAVPEHSLGTHAVGPSAPAAAAAAVAAHAVLVHGLLGSHGEVGLAKSYFASCPSGDRSTSDRKKLKSEDSIYTSHIHVFLI